MKKIMMGALRSINDLFLTALLLVVAVGFTILVLYIVTTFKDLANDIDKLAPSADGTSLTSDFP